jgi:serine/threonine protein phosphatase PrpC
MSAFAPEAVADTADSSPEAEQQQQQQHSSDATEASSAASPPINYRLVTSFEEMNPRRRNTMEDVHRIVPALGGDPEMSYFGVYDGHGGRHIVDFLEYRLEENIVEELRQTDDASMLERLSRAFLITDVMSKQGNIVTSGATAVSLLLHNTEVGKKMYVANVGDSRAVLCCQNDLAGVATSTPSGYLGLRLTFDHRPDDAGEIERVNEAGGFIARGRVLGILAVTRSFGDHGMKDFVTAQPYLVETDLATHGECPFVILACDGVWDVLTDQEAVDMILVRYLAEGPFDEAAKILVQTALDKGSTDNITAVVIFL